MFMSTAVQLVVLSLVLQLVRSYAILAKVGDHSSVF